MRTWQEEIIEARLPAFRTMKLYEAEIGGKARQMCLVFGAQDLMAVYVPQSSLSDLWAQILDGLHGDTRYRAFSGETVQGMTEGEAGYALTTAHGAWVDAKRGVAVTVLDNG